MFNERNKVKYTELKDDMADGSLTPEERLMGMVSRNELVSFIRYMPEAKKQAIFLKAYHHMSNTQITEALGISEAAARRRISNAYAMIKDFVNGGLNDGSNGKSEHWVVVTKYKGDGLNKPASDFTCADPWTGTFVPLDKATCFNKITQYVVFK